MDLPELESVWSKIQGFYEKPEGDLFAHLNQRLSNIFAGIAILVDNKKIIRDVHPEYFEWINQVVSDVLEKFIFNLRDSTMVIGPSGWEGFAAIFVPHLFAGDPHDKVRRRWIAILALNFNNEAVGRLFKTIAGYFKFSDKIFIQLQNLMIQRCNLVSQHAPHHWDEEVDWKDIFKEILEAFVNGDTQDTLIDICSFQENDSEENEPDETRRFPRRGIKVKELRDPGIEISLLYPSLQFPEIEVITDEKERAFIMAWYQKLIQLQTNIWGPVDEDELPLDISLHDFDHWVILKLSFILPKVNAAEADSLWKPLLAYGNRSAKWLISFFDNLLVYNYQKPENYDALGAIWNEMIDYALAQPTWKYDHRFYHNHWDLWQGVLGISRVQMEVWKAGYQKLLLKFSPKTMSYIIRSYSNKEAINKLAILLRSPGAANFIIPGVLLISAHLKYQDAVDKEETPSGFVRVPFDHYDSVANTCSYLWSNHKQAIRDDGMTFLSFKDIVIHLVAIQNPIGLDLQDRLIE